MATPSMLQSGLSRELFEAWVEDPRNGVIIADFAVQVSRQEWLQWAKPSRVVRYFPQQQVIKSLEEDLLPATTSWFALKSLQGNPLQEHSLAQLPCNYFRASNDVLAGRRSFSKDWLTCS